MSVKIFYDNKEISFEDFKNLKLPYVQNKEIVYKDLHFVLGKLALEILWNPENHNYNKGYKDTPNVIGGYPFSNNYTELRITKDSPYFSIPRDYNEIKTIVTDNSDYEDSKIITFKKSGVFRFTGYTFPIKDTKMTILGGVNQSTNIIPLFHKDVDDLEGFITHCKKTLFQYSNGDILAINYNQVNSSSAFLELLGFKIIQKFTNPNTGALLNYYKLNYENLS